MATKRRLPTTLFLNYTVNGKPTSSDDMISIFNIPINGTLMKKIIHYLSSQSYIGYVSSEINNTHNSLQVEFIEHKNPYPLIVQIENYQIGVTFYF
jgi:hypothetical protein